VSSKPEVRTTETQGPSRIRKLLEAADESAEEQRIDHMTRQHHSMLTILSHQPRLQFSANSNLHARPAATMSSIAAMASRRALARQPIFRAPPRRFMSSKVEEASLDKAPKKDPELYVRLSNCH
jgi:hypothetical protein